MRSEISTLDANRVARLVFARFDPLAAGVAVGSVWGAMLALATARCVLGGQPDLEEGLSLLAHFFPGYEVSWRGVWIGFLDAAVAGFGFGFSAALLNNFCLQICKVLIRNCAEFMKISDWL